MKIFITNFLEVSANLKDYENIVEIKTVIYYLDWTLRVSNHTNEYLMSYLYRYL